MQKYRFHALGGTVVGRRLEIDEKIGVAVDGGRRCLDMKKRQRLVATFEEGAVRLQNHRQP